MNIGDVLGFITEGFNMFQMQQDQTVCTQVPRQFSTGLKFLKSDKYLIMPFLVEAFRIWLLYLLLEKAISLLPLTNTSLGM